MGGDLFMFWLNDATRVDLLDYMASRLAGRLFWHAETPPTPLIILLRQARDLMGMLADDCSICLCVRSGKRGWRWLPYLSEVDYKRSSSIDSTLSRLPWADQMLLDYSIHW